MSMMKLCLGVKTTQSIISVISQLVFLVSYNDINDPMMSTQAKICLLYTSPSPRDGW